MEYNKDIDFIKLEGKTIKEVYRYNGNLIITFTDGSHTGIYNKAEIRDGELELGCRVYSV